MYKTTPISVRDVFGLPVDPAFMLEKKVFDPANAEIIKAIPDEEFYVFQSDTMRDLFAWLNFMTEPLLIWGPTGAGKTTVVQQTAARLGIPVWEFTGNEESELMELFGHQALGPNGSEWRDGPLTRAARNGGWLVINEADRMRPGVLVGLNDVLEMGPFTLAGNHGEVIKPHPDFRIIVTANTNLSGDVTRTYNTAKIHDKSVLERFGLVLQVGYLPPELEEKILEERFKGVTDAEIQFWMAEEGVKVQAAADPNILLEGEKVQRKDLISGMVRLANMIRSQAVTSDSTAGAALERTMSTRSLSRWADGCIIWRKATEKNLSVLHYSLERRLTNGCKDTTKTTMHALLTQVFAVDRKL
jgi:cobaltochelatase CobS